ncbi:MAG TPA: ABC transporter substrate-binding protein [Candidatus Edwardsbacteria bacterium]|nr:ABC transporter substrate-binding protein [Candidatus Edwardsbacteria bacterium]
MNGRPTTRRAALLALLCVPLALLATGGCARRPAKTLVVAYEDGAISLDPYLQDESVTMSLLANIYEGLVGFDPDMRIVPLVAEGYDNPGLLTWRFFLRPGVAFHSGRRLTAADVVYSLDRARRLPSSVFRGMLSAITSVRALDSMTVEVVTSRPQPIMINILAQVAVVPRGADPQQLPDGTGPYRYLRSLPDRGIELAANERYWGGRPAFPLVRFRSIPDGAERAAALLRGEIDLSASIGEQQRGAIARDRRFRLAIEPSMSVSILGLNIAGRGTPLADPRVRQAISLALDRRAIIAATYGGYAMPANQLVHPTVFGFDPALPALAPDSARSVALLRAAGYGGGTDLQLDVASDLIDEAGPLVQQLRRVGIRLTVAAVPWNQLYRKIDQGRSAFYRMGVACSFGDASEILNDLHTARGDYGHRNASGYSDPELDRLIEQADREFNTAQRQRMLQRAMRLAMNDLPMIPLFLREDCYGVSTALDWRPRADGMILAKDIRPAKR